MKKDGFTFVELMIAVVIGAFVTVTAVAAMSGIASGKRTHQRLTELNDEVRYAERLIRQDLINMYRSSDFKDTQFELSYLDTDDGIETQSLTFYTVSQKKVRPLQPEGDVYEVQYAMKNNAETDQIYLTRRCCPIVPGVSQNDEDRGWGVLVPIAENIAAMKIRCYDGKEWIDEWNEKFGKFPELVEVTLVAVSDNNKRSLKRSFLTNIPRIVTDSHGADSQDQEKEQEEATSQQKQNGQTNTNNQPSNMESGGER